MTTDTKRKPEDKIAEPPKKWRNWYVTIKPYRVRQTKEIRNVGQVFCGSGVYPSKEIAEEKAAESARDPNRGRGAGRAQYLGAEPEQ